MIQHLLVLLFSSILVSGSRNVGSHQIPSNNNQIRRPESINSQENEIIASESRDLKN